MTDLGGIEIPADLRVLVDNAGTELDYLPVESDMPANVFRPRAVPVTRYRYRHAQIPTPWASATTGGTPAPAV